MRALQFSVVVLPKLDSEEKIGQIREKYDPWYYQISPYIPVVAPFTPTTLDDIENVSGHISLARRDFHPVAVSFRECLEVDDRLVFLMDRGREELVGLQRSLAGTGSVTFPGEAEYEPRLVIGRVPDPHRRSQALADARRVGRILGVVDSVSLLEIESEGEMRLTANYPFGIGRVDYAGPFRV